MDYVSNFRDPYDKKVRQDLKFSSVLKIFENFAIFNIASIWQRE